MNVSVVRNREMWNMVSLCIFGLLFTCFLFVFFLSVWFGRNWVNGSGENIFYISSMYFRNFVIAIFLSCDFNIAVICPIPTPSAYEVISQRKWPSSYECWTNFNPRLTRMLCIKFDGSGEERRQRDFSIEKFTSALSSGELKRKILSIKGSQRCSNNLKGEM